MSDEKAPWYPWFPRDFSADEPVKLMSLEAEGAYRRLLDHQWLHGSIPREVNLQAAICKNIPVRLMIKLWPAIDSCFHQVEGDPVRLQNRKLERIRVEQMERRTKAVESGRAGAFARWGHKQSDGDGMATPLAPPIGNPSNRQWLPETETKLKSNYDNNSDRSILLQRFAEGLHRDAVDRALRSARNPDVLASDLRARLDGMPGHQSATPEEIGGTLHEMQASADPPALTPKMLDIWVNRGRQPAPLDGTDETDTDRYLRQLKGQKTA